MKSFSVSATVLTAIKLILFNYRDISVITIQSIKLFEVGSSSWQIPIPNRPDVPEVELEVFQGLPKRPELEESGNPVILCLLNVNCQLLADFARYMQI